MKLVLRQLKHIVLFENCATRSKVMITSQHNFFSNLSDLTLGTVQLGMPYGVACKTSPPSLKEGYSILTQAVESGITCFDTARAYGSSEYLIGGWQQTTDAHPLIITKIKPIPNNCNEEEAIKIVEESLNESMRALQRVFLPAVMLHRGLDILRPEVFNTLAYFVETGKIRTIGVSVYEPSELSLILDKFKIDIVQIPASIIDTRFDRSGLLVEATGQGITVFSRSALLQGMLLMHPDNLPEWQMKLRNSLYELREIASYWNLTLVQLAISGMTANRNIRSIVIGVSSRAELVELIDASDQKIPPSVLDDLYELAASVDEKLINPRYWPR